MSRFLSQMDMNSTDRPALVGVVMGVAGVGKTTVGRRVAERLGWDFYDGDAYHPEANVKKMSSGIALTDGDRIDWLTALRSIIRKSLDANRRAIVTCSALKESYRRMLQRGNDGVVWIFLKADPAVVRERIRRRSGHFFDPDLLQSQYDALEEPANAVTVDAERPFDEVVEAIVQALS